MRGRREHTSRPRRTTAPADDSPGRRRLRQTTAIMPAMPRTAQRSVDAYVHRNDPQVATQVEIAPGEGAIMAMVTGHDTAEGTAFRQGTHADDAKAQKRNRLA